MTASTRKTLNIALLVVLAGFLVHYSLFSMREYADFKPLYRSGERFLWGRDLYNFADGHFLFKYAPFAGAMFAPLAALPWALASVIWVTGAWALLGVTYVQSRRWIMGRETLPLWVGLLVFLGVSKFTLAEVRLGQVNYPLLFFALAAIISLGKSWEGWGGALLAVATLFKPPLALLLVVALWRRRPKFVLGFAVGLTAGLLLPILRYGWIGTLDLYRGWWEVMWVSSPGQMESEVNQSLPGALTRWLVHNPYGSSFATLPPEAPMIITGIIFALYLALAWWMELRSRTNPELAPVAPVLLLTGTVLFNPLGWVQNYIFLAPALILAFRYVLLERGRGRTRVALVALFFLAAVLPNYEMMGRHLHNHYLAQSWIFLGVAALMAALVVPLRYRHA
ncbi:MAG: DUF2029 domain-containing protein [Candidatus Zixiibacteriota bacterium]|nr:MAG: DUF2029 domain-containing protein [candidate division Zixibacteria bacterium]